MRRRSTRLALIGAVLLVGLGVYAGFWWFVAGRIKEAVAAAPEMLRARKIDASWQSVRVAGFPFAFRVELSEVTIRAAAATPAAALHAPALSASARPWNFRAWDLAAPAGIAGAVGPDAAPLAKLGAPAASGAVAVGGDGGVTIWLTLDQPKLAAVGGEIDAGAADYWVMLPPRPPAAHTDAGLAVAAALRDLAMPVAPPGFAKTIESVGFGVTLMGALPPGPLRQAAAAWRDSGGTLELDQFHLRWGELGITGSGTLALDNDLQPVGGFSGAIAGYDQLMTALVTAGRIKAGDARVARLALAILAKAGPDGRPEISTSFRIQDGEMFLGPAKLGKAPHIDWQ
jgi:hypothetical protein